MASDLADHHLARKKRVWGAKLLRQPAFWHSRPPTQAPELVVVGAVALRSSQHLTSLSSNRIPECDSTRAALGIRGLLISTFVAAA